MTESAQAAAAQPAAPGPVANAVLAKQPLSQAQATALLREARGNAGATGLRDHFNKDGTQPVKAGPAKDISEAARKLGQQGAKARQERQAEATGAQDLPEGEGAAEAMDTSEEGTQGDLTAEGDTQSEGIEAEGHEGEPAEGQTIDFGDGVTMTKEEAKASILRQADYTKKTTALANRAKALDAYEADQLTKAGQMLSILETRIGKPKSLSEHLKDTGGNSDLALARLAEQDEQMGAVSAARELHSRNLANAITRAYADRDTQLAESYNPAWTDAQTRDAAYVKLSEYAVSLGASPKEVGHLTRPWMIQILDKAAKFDAIEAGRSKVKQTLADKPKVLRPGARLGSQGQQNRSLTAAHDKLKSSGSLQDAVALLRQVRGKR